MSIYDGTTIGEREYAHGRDEGRAAAEGLVAAGFPSFVHDEEAEGRRYAAGAYSERTRAYWLGWLRGFREVSR